MKPRFEFLIPKDAAEARAMQEELRNQLRLVYDVKNPHLIAGIDVGYDNARGLARASIVSMALDDLQPREQVQALVPVDFPYIAGLLSFREIPAIVEALSRLRERPDILMVDGQGIAHPRRMGIAAHLGVLVDMPSIGVAKSRLTGNFTMPGPVKSEQSPLMHGKERIGTVLRSKYNTNPLFISPGHRMDIPNSVAITLKCLTKYRLPEPTRMADRLSKKTVES